MRMSNSAARGFLAAMVGSALVAGCGGQGSNTGQSPSAMGQVESALARSQPLQVGTWGPTSGVTVTNVTAGNAHVFAITSDNNRWGWGFNAFGQVGNGTTIPSLPVPVGLVPGLSNVTSFAGGKLHSVFLSGGTVLTYGHNIYGQLGDGSTTPSSSGVSPILGTFTAVAAGWHHSVALKSDGTLWAWGYNASGCLGDGTYFNPRTTPVQVTGLTGVTISAIAANGENTYALDSNGDVWAWGLNTFNQLGSAGNPSATPQKVPGLSSVMAIAAGHFSVLALKTDGSVWKSGDSLSAPTLVSGLSNITSIAANGSHYLAVDQSGALWSWGSNSNGQLGDCTTTNRTTPVQVASSCTGGTPAGYLTNVVSVTASDASSFAVLTDGTLWSWGGDSSGILGTNNI